MFKSFQKLSWSNRLRLIQRNVSTETATKINSFNDEIKYRRDQAKKTFIIRSEHRTRFDQIIGYFQKYGKIEKCYHLGHDSMFKRILLEFDNEKNAEIFLKDSIKSNPITIAEPFVRGSNRFLEFDLKKFTNTLKPAFMQIVSEQNNENIRNVIGSFRAQQLSIDEQVVQMYERTRLSDLAIRLRFMTLLQIENIVNELFPTLIALPFGSSVNGFGRMGSDLDIVLSNVSNEMNSTHTMSPIKFITKNVSNTTRDKQMLVFETISKLVSFWMPGASETICINHAKVPIVKYKQNLTGVEVDLSVSNLSGYRMSELLHLCGIIDNRVRPLVFFVRRWAESTNITTKLRPSPTITNFQLTCLVLYFLQQLPQPILPSIDSMMIISENMATNEFETIKMFNQLNFNRTNNDTLEQLIEQFFLFYSEFEFEKKKISLNTAETTFNEFNVPMYITNPLEMQQNICRNVMQPKCVDFIDKSKKALVTLKEIQKNETTFLSHLLLSDDKLEIRLPRKLQLSNIQTKPLRRTNHNKKINILSVIKKVNGNKS